MIDLAVINLAVINLAVINLADLSSSRFITATHGFLDSP